VKQLSFFSRPAASGPAAGKPGGTKRLQAAVAPRRLRFLQITSFFIFWAVVICGRLFWLQVVRHPEFMARAAREQQRTFEVAPRRGILYDRNLHELAMTVLADSVYAVPSQIASKHDPEARAKYLAAAQQLAKIVHIDPEDRFTSAHQIAARLNASREFAWVARKLPPPQIARVKALGMKGIYFQPEFKRYYPNQQLAAQVLGYVGTDDNGLGGIESEYNHDLRGVPGRMLTALDARRRVMGSQERDPQPGDNLVLTLDENIQFMAEQALDRNMERTHALSGTVIVQDPQTGQILALAVRPTFDPNHFRHDKQSLLRDHAVTDVYEPGSVFKLVTYSAALQEHVVTPDSMIPTLGGKIDVAGRIVHDDGDAIRYEGQHNNVLTATQALEQSSDVAAVELAERMGKDRFYQYIRSFGFGQRTGIELPGETRGLLKPPQRWNPTTIGSIPMGQEIGVTPLQLVTMVSTIANGGVYLPPHILLRNSANAKGGRLLPAAFHPEHELVDPRPAGAHRVISTLTAAEMRKMMQGVVEHGTGIPAQLNGYSAAGKTGTAQKIDVATHRYSKTEYVASFAGFAPVSDPAITIAVVMNSPAYQFHYGTQASAPVFRELAQQILEYLGVPHDEPLKTTQEMAAIASQPAEGDEPEQHLDDLNSLFDEVNDLPADDPLRAELSAQQADSAAEASGAPAGKPPEQASLSQPNGPAVAAVLPPPSSHSAAAPAAPAGSSSPQGGIIVVDAHHRVAVPSFLGEPVRQAVESAGRAGLGLRVVGSGIAREQVPAPGTMVPLGTGIVVQFSR